ncbi:uncharacterized protein LOC143290987 [Babylonia areolata]|uniref:uncharacterized protein LOC143290987 n=1 Tax=Babylonia areolata TaxID=304850 RepID=UPI003FCEEDC1
MIAKRRLTVARFFQLGALALLTFLLVMVSQRHPLDLSALNPIHILPRLSAIRPLIAASSDQILRKTGPPRKCALYTLRAGKRKGGEREAECRRVSPVPGSCDVADRLFRSTPPAHCDGGQKHVQFCSLTSTDSGHRVQCSLQQCASHLLGAAVDVPTGGLKWKRFQSPQALEEWISGLLRPVMEGRRHFGFCFIGCGETSEQEDGGLGYLQDDTDSFYQIDALQILLLPPQMTAGYASRSHSDFDINFNLIFIDSVSRQHFFRSMPDTLKLFEDLTNNNTSGVSVFDFELVQAVRSRTFETLQMLFSGEVDPSVKPFGVLELPPEPLKTEALLKKLKERGYSTLWLEDLCYLWEWGISKDLLVHNKSLTPDQTWRRLQKALSKAGIDSLEVTYAMCKVLSENGVPDHFHGPDAVCLNGRHQHDYLLDYLWLYQQTMVKTGTPFFSFLETNVGHEDSGRRIKTFDRSLQHHLESVLKLKNTVTIIFSDHGNSYGTFIEKSMEGRMELFHPHLFILVPDGVAGTLGPAAMEALRVNQHRLVSHLDLHYALQSLAYNHQNTVSEKHFKYNVSSRGLLSIVSSSRSCGQIPRIMPNLCICQNFDMAVDSDNYHALFAHLALAKINTEIQHQFLQSGSQHTQAFGHCRRLVLGDFKNIRKSFNGTTVSLKMDLLVPLEEPGNESEESLGQAEEETVSRPMEIFFVSMEVQLGGNSAVRPGVILERLDRITPYSKFSVCADRGVELRLCVCDVNATHDPRKSISETSAAHFDFHLRPEIFVADGTGECLQLILKKNKHGGVFSAANVCTGKVFKVVFSLETSEMIVSDAMPREARVFPGQEEFLCMAVATAPKVDWSWAFTLQHLQQDL